MNNESSSSSSFVAPESAAPGGPGRHQVQSVEQLRELISQTQQERAPEAPRSYIWIPFNERECAKVREDPPRPTLNESAQAHANGTGVRQIAMDLRRQAGEDLTKPYTEAELCAAFNASDRQAELLEHAAQKSPAVIQTGVDNPRPPQKGDTVYILGHGRSDHEVLFANHSDVRLNPVEVVQRMQENQIADDIGKLKLLSCGSHGQIHQGLAAACQDQKAYLDTRLTGYGFAKPDAPDTSKLAPGEYSKHNSLNFSYIRDAQPDVPKLTANLNLGHVTTAIKKDFQDVIDFDPSVAELQADVDVKKQQMADLKTRLENYDEGAEDQKLAELQAAKAQATEAYGDFMEDSDPDSEGWKERDLELSNQEKECGEQIRTQQDFMEEHEAHLNGEIVDDGLQQLALDNLEFAEERLKGAQVKELELKQKMGLEPEGNKAEAMVRKSTDAKVVAKVRDILRPEVPQPALAGPGLEGVPVDTQEIDGYSAGPVAARAPAPPPPPPLPKAGPPSTREQFKRASAGAEGGGGPKVG
ncbi:MAG: hypothetical protein V4599_01720 [Verrucomicrobiota bacterium]